MAQPTSFAALGLSHALAQAAAQIGYGAPTPIQLQAIPVVLQGADLLGWAPTGSGKTAAFVLPLLQRMLQGRQHTPRRVRVLVLAPTRELAAQVGEVFRRLAAPLAERFKVAVLFGGVSLNPQMMGLRGGADIVVATPGRLLDLVAHNALTLLSVEMLVLDEADRLLDLGFADELARVLVLLPAQRQNMFFSATLGPDMQALAQGLLRSPVQVQASATPGAEPVIVQRAIQVNPGRRTALLLHLIAQEQWERVLVFVATQFAADRVASKLYKAGLYATPFHGGMSQGARTQVLAEFQRQQWDVVVTTDLAARGLDIAQLPTVVNYDLPRSADGYLHRIGRTGRAGASGVALSFIGATDEAHFRLIEKRQGMLLPREQIAGFEAREEAPGPADAAPGKGGIKGRRPSKKDKLRAAAPLKT
ncbi:MAG: DEAD/DEAH box helicase [Burkholderiaceae bacterium]